MLSQHLEAMSLVNGEFEDLILLARQLVLVLESESISMRTMISPNPSPESYNQDEEVRLEGAS